MNRELGRVASSKGDGTEYVIMGLEGGRVICGCPGFSYRRTCKHIREWQDAHPEGFVEVKNGEDLIGGKLEDWVMGQECKESPDGRHLFVLLKGMHVCWWCKLEKEVEWPPHSKGHA